MKIKLNETYKLLNRIDKNYRHEIFYDIDESDDFMEIVETITTDYKHKIFDILRNAIDCGFDHEILSNDYGYDDDLINLIIPYGDNEIEINF